MSVILASPTYQAVAPVCRDGMIVSAMYAANRGVKWHSLADIHSKQTTIDDVRNRIVRAAIKVAETDDVQGIAWIDSDISPKPDGLYRLIESGKDFITGIYTHRSSTGEPVVGFLDPRANGGKGAVAWMQEWPANTIAPVDCCGFGIVYTSMRMLRLMSDPWFSFGDLSEDFTFCVRAKAAGFQLYVDTAVTCAHVGDPHEFTVEAYQARYRAKQKDAARSAA
jgi:hypothetical protein